ncbi:MAG: DUF4124 domain-containing protein [Gammaproteobacteria bacterium]|nr:DUF4124 domain-containing protein [Gammaproteobacteria bacterium]
MHKTFLLACSLIVFPGITQAGIYKWTDEQGNVHYSQEKPKNQAVESIKGNYRAPEDRSSYKRPTLGLKNKNKTDAAENNSQNPEQQEQTAQQQKPAEEKTPKLKPKQKKAGCESARNNLATMQAKGQIRRRDKDGNVSYMSEAEKQARIKRTQEIIKKNCK